VLTAIEVGEPVKAGQAYSDFTAQELKQSMASWRPCVRGRMWRKTIYNPSRLKYPMKNVGERGIPQWVRITWTEALDTTAAKIKQIIEKYGPLCSYSGTMTQTSGGISACRWIGYDMVTWIAQSYSGHEVGDMLTYGKPLFQNYSEARDTETTSFFSTKLALTFGWEPMVTEYCRGYYLLRAREMSIPIIIVSPT
jgi:anaerobic dimethyl sulfoxide reductase subunit A